MPVPGQTSAWEKRSARQVCPLTACLSFPPGLTILFTAVAIVMSEAASNTASANMIVPIAIAVSQAAGVDPVQPALGATLGASMGFMMPISTPPNAIVYSSGHVPITAMMRHGLVLDAVGFIVIVAMLLAMGRIF